MERRHYYPRRFTYIDDFRIRGGGVVGSKSGRGRIRRTITIAELAAISVALDAKLPEQTAPSPHTY